MECIPKDQFLHFHPDTKSYLRKKYNFDKPGEMDEAVDLFQDWVKKQKHFLTRDFPRPYLERLIILSKGSVERAKSQLDKICTLRTLLPQFFNKYDAKDDIFKALKGNSTQILLRDLTDDHYRVYITKFAANGTHKAKIYFVAYLNVVLIQEYMKANDYCDGIVIIADLRGVNIVDFATETNLDEMRQIITISIEGYGARLKQIHIISESKAIDILIKIYKQMVSNKIGSRIQVHKTIDEVYQYVPRKMLPDDLGGDEKPMEQLHDEFIEELSKPENVKYFKEMSNARTDESLRSTATFNEQYLGIAARPFLERQIILSKGSVERAKSQLDKICTLRTLLPQFFDKCDAKNDFRALKGYCPQTMLKDLTDDHCRVYISKFAADGKHSAKINFITYLYAVLIIEYMKANDYCDGTVVIADFRGVNIVDFAKAINLNEMRQMATVAIDGYSARLKQIFILSDSKVIDLLINIFKQMVSSKIGSRIQVHQTVETIYQYVPRKILPADLGGDQKTMEELHDEFIEELSKPEHVKYFKEMCNARTDESLRSTATFNEQYLGIAGTFRTLNVD